MSGRPARKRIHYLRAVFPQGARGNIKFQTMISNALQRLTTVASTEVPIASLGVLAIRNRNIVRNRLEVVIGGGAPEESMSTMGLRVNRPVDAEVTENPPANRVFKTSDAFCLVSGDEVLVAVDGMRVNAVEKYFQRLIANADQAAGHSAFELRPVADHSQEDILEIEGVKELQLSGTAFKATDELNREEYDDNAEGIISQLWSETKDRFRALLSEQVQNERELLVLAEHWADLNITTTIKASGGSRAEPIVLSSMQNAGLDLIEDRPDNVTVTLVTQKGSKISGSSLVLGKYISLMRQTGRNDLPYFDVWTALQQYQSELIQSGHWGG